MPASLATKCPDCGAGYRLKDPSAAGKRMKCRRCEKTFVIRPAGARRHAKVTAEEDEFGGLDDFGPSGGSRGEAFPPALPPRRTGSKKAKSKTKSRRHTRPKAARAAGRKKTAKTSKPGEAAGGGVTIITIAGGVVVLIALIVGAIVFLRPAGAEGIKPPTSYVKFEHPVNKLFRCEYPADWEVEQGGRVGSVIWAWFRKGEAKINVRKGMSGGAMGDLFGAANPDPDAPEDLTPVAQLHASPFMKGPVADEFDDYTEQAARTVRSGMGDARVSEFTAAGSWGSKIRGFRATILGREQLRVVCSCPEDDWEVCRPIFERVITSIN